MKLILNQVIQSIIKAGSEFGANIWRATVIRKLYIRQSNSTESSSSIRAIMANLNYDNFFEELSDKDMGALGVALDEIQDKCDFCKKGTTNLLRSIAKDLIICQQVTLACRRLPDKEATKKQDRLALMATKRADIVQWEDLFHSRSKGICKLCQVQTNEAIAMWQLGKRL